MHVMDCSGLFIYLLRFFYVASDGATAKRLIPDRICGQFLTSLRKDSVANYGWIRHFYTKSYSSSNASMDAG